MSLTFFKKALALLDSHQKNFQHIANLVPNLFLRYVIGSWELDFAHTITNRLNAIKFCRQRLLTSQVWLLYSSSVTDSIMCFSWSTILISEFRALSQFLPDCNFQITNSFTLFFKGFLAQISQCKSLMLFLRITHFWPSQVLLRDLKLNCSYPTRGLGADGPNYSDSTIRACEVHHLKQLNYKIFRGKILLDIVKEWSSCIYQEATSIFNIVNEYRSHDLQFPFSSRVHVPNMSPFEKLTLCFLTPSLSSMSLSISNFNVLSCSCKLFFLSSSAL